MAQGDLIMSDTLRCCDPERDIAAIVEIENTAWVHAGFQFQATDEALLRNRWERMPTFVPERDCVVIERDGVVCAYGMVLPGETSAGERVFTLQGGVHPRAQRSGCGAVVLRWQEQRAREIAAGPCIVEMTMIDGQAGQRAFVAAAGFTPAWRYAQMLCELSVPLDVPQLPSGLRVRTPEVSERRRVLEARNAAFRSARGHVEERTGNAEHHGGHRGHGGRPAERLQRDRQQLLAAERGIDDGARASGDDREPAPEDEDPDGRVDDTPHHAGNGAAGGRTEDERNRGHGRMHRVRGRGAGHTASAREKRQHRDHQPDAGDDARHQHRVTRHRLLGEASERIDGAGGRGGWHGACATRGARGTQAVTYLSR